MGKQVRAFSSSFKYVQGYLGAKIFFYGAGKILRSIVATSFLNALTRSDVVGFLQLFKNSSRSLSKLIIQEVLNLRQQ